jgi:hypothetical protein
MFFDIVHHRGCCGRIGDVSGMERDIATDFRGSMPEAVMTACGERDLRALRGKHPRDGETNAAAGAGDESDAPLKLEFHLAASSIQRTVMSR